MRTKTSSLKPRIPKHSRLHDTLIKGERGFTQEQIVGFILVLMAMTALLWILQKPVASTIIVLSPLEAKEKNSVCAYQHQLLKSCTPSDNDKDGDCLSDECDFCVGQNSKSPAKDEPQQQAIGSNLFDKDGDGMPDACDIEPGVPEVSTCDKAPDGRCNIAAHYYDKARKEITLASLGTRKKTIDDITFG